MKTTFIDYAERLLKMEDLPQIFSELSQIFDKLCLYHESGACLEKLWHATQRPELYWEIGNIFADKLENPQVAFQAYNRFFQSSNAAVWRKYTSILEKVGHNGFFSDMSQDNYANKIVVLSDIFQIIIYMMIGLNRLQDFDGIIELKPFYKKAEQELNCYCQKNQVANNYLDENMACKNHLSGILSENYNRNDLNKFAIELNPENQKAYVNIIDDLITYKNFTDAITFYNNEYAFKFQKPHTGSIINLCWVISDYYRDIFDFYKSVFFQKIALELELGTEGEISA